MTNPAPPVDDARVTEAMIAVLLDLKMEDGKIKNDHRFLIAKWTPKIAFVLALSRIPSEEATEEEIRLALSGLGNYKLKEVNVAELLSRSSLRITRAPGAKTSARNALQGE